MGNGWGTAGKIIEVTGISFETTEHGIIAAQKLGNAGSFYPYIII